MSDREAERLNKALDALKSWTMRLFECADESSEDAEVFWNRLAANNLLLREFAYYYDNREFWCGYSIDGYTIADILVWQTDHFKAHMDRADSANRYDKDKLVLNTFKTMLELADNPDRIKAEFSQETGTDLAGGWNLH